MCRPSGAVSLESVVREAVAALTPLAQTDDITLDVSTRARPAAGHRRARRADPAVPEPDPQRDQVWPRRAAMSGSRWPRRPAPGGRGAATDARGRVRDDGEGIPPDADPAPDRAILPGRREAQPREGRHRPGPRHRQAHRQPPSGPAARSRAGRARAAHSPSCCRPAPASRADRRRCHGNVIKLSHRQWRGHA